MEQIRIGIIGIGNMGTTHCQNILRGECPEICLVAVADRSEARRQWVKENLPQEVQVFTQGSDLIANATVDAILIAVPHYQHPVLALEAFAKGLHVMCEKPAGVFTKAVREMNAAAESSGKIFGMMFNQRTNSLYKKMHELVHSGKYGAIRRVNWLITDWFRTQSYYDSGAWRATWQGEGGGVLLNQCPHNLDLMQWICGMPTKVQAFLHQGKWHDIEVEDDVTAYMEYANGATGVFITTTGDAPGTNRFEITMDGAKLVCEDNQLKLYALDCPVSVFLKESKEGFAQPKCTISTVETDGTNPQHVGVLNAFAACILRGEPLIANGTEGINGLTLSNAMHLSSWTNAAVCLPIDEDLFLRELDQRRASSRLKEETGVTFSTANSYGS